MSAISCTVRVADVQPSTANVRESLTDIEELAWSIRAQGVLQPVIVNRRKDGRLVIIDGHRRHAAARLARDQSPSGDRHRGPRRA